MDRQQYYMQVAEITAMRGTCRIGVGAVAVKDKRIIATAYNGAPSGMAECSKIGCHIINGHCQRAIHAEQNLIALAAKNGFSLFGCDVYVTHEPCANCMKLMIAAGIERIYFKTEYKDDRTLSEYYERIKVYKYAESDWGDYGYFRFRR